MKKKKFPAQFCKNIVVIKYFYLKNSKVQRNYSIFYKNFFRVRKNFWKKSVFLLCFHYFITNKKSQNCFGNFSFFQRQNLNFFLFCQLLFLFKYYFSKGGIWKMELSEITLNQTVLFNVFQLFLTGIVFPFSLLLITYLSERGDK